MVGGDDASPTSRSEVGRNGDRCAGSCACRVSAGAHAVVDTIKALESKLWMRKGTPVFQMGPFGQRAYACTIWRPMIIFWMSEVPSPISMNADSR